MARSFRKKGRLNGKYTTTTDANGFVTYTCHDKHPGMPGEKFVTGSRRKIRQHIREEMGY